MRLHVVCTRFLPRVCRFAGILLATSLSLTADPPDLPVIPNQVLIQGAPAVAVPLPLAEPEPPAVWRYRLTTSRTDLLDVPRVELAQDGRRYAVLAAKAGAGTGTTLLTLAVAEGTITNTTTFACTVRPAEFGVATNWLSGSVSGRVASAVDLNQDGLMDLLCSYSSGSDPVLLRYRNVAFQSGSLNLLQQTVWSDWDGDGDADAWLRGNPRNSFWNNINGRLTAATSPTDTLTLSGGAWADFDADGRVELLVTAARPNRATDPVPPPRLLRRDAGGASELTVTLPPTAAPPVVTDFDGDGLPDVWLANTTHSTNGVVFRNDGELQFSPSPLVTPVTPSFAVADAGWTDFTGDGRPDLWLVESNRFNAAPRRVLTLFAHAGDTFTPAHRWEQDQFAAGSPAWADFDGDGLPDFIGSVASPRLHWFDPAGPQRTNHFVLFRNTGRGFEPGDFLALVDGNARLATPAVMDANADGTPDVWVATQQGRALVGRYVEQNLPPTAPTGLRTFVSGLSVLFLWNPAGDPNQSAPLTYNLRVGSRPGGNDIVASLTGTNHTRLVMDHGNCGFQTFRLVHLPNLDVDELYWSVQAVDHGFLAGPFAPQQHLPLSIPGNEPPIITGLTNVVMEEGTTVTLRYVVTDDRTRPENLTLQVFTSNPTLFPNFTPLSGRPARATHDTITTNRSLHLAPARFQFGSTELAVVATDRGGLATTNQFTVTVTPFNDPPGITLPPPPAGLAGQPLENLLISLDDVDNDPASLSLAVHSEALELLRNDEIQVTGTGPTRLLNLRPTAARVGAVPLRLTARDPGGKETTTTLTVSFLPMAFRAAATELPAVAGMEFLPGDLDGDGDLDVLVVQPAGRVEIFTNDGEGGFTLTGFHQEIGEKPLAALGDLDLDGRLDLVLSGLTSSSRTTTAWLRRDSGYAETGLPGTLAHTILHGSLALTDLDLDGDLDVLLAGMNSAQLTAPAVTSWENGGGSWTHRPQTLVVGTPSQPITISRLVFGDFNADGRLDFNLPVQAQNFGALALAYGLGALPFEFTSLTMPWSADGRELAAWADFDLDGQADGLGPVALAPTVLYRGVRPGSFAAVAQSGVAATDLFPADLDHDGRPDLLAATGPLGMSFNRRDHIWLAGRVDTNAIISRTPAIADFDGDGTLDALLTRQFALAGGGYTNRTELLRGFALATNPPPAAPGGLHVLNFGRASARLHWQAAADPNQPGGHTYNLRVGTAPGAADVLAPALSPTGARLLAGPGNAGWPQQRLLRGLVSGRTYYWSVQAVDASFVAGPFAPEQSFTFDAGLSAPALTIEPQVFSGLAKLTLRGDPGASARLERSTDLRTWQHVTLETLDAAGEFQTTQYSGAETIFYRVRYPE